MVAAPASLSTHARSRNLLFGAIAAGVLVAAGAGYTLLGRDRAPAAPATAVAQSAAPATAPAASPAAAVPAGSAVIADAPVEPGTVIISALGMVNPNDPRFNGDAAAAQAEARADAKRQLIEKALSLYVDNTSLNKNYAMIEQKLLSQPGVFIKTVLQDGTAAVAKDGLIEAEARAVVKMREVQKSLNQLSREERIEFIRNHGDPKVSILMSIANADTAQALPPARSQLAENIVKERIKSFGFRVWANDGEAKTGPDAKGADFLIAGEVKVKLLSMKLAASGLTVTKTVLTSWTVKAIDKATGEEIYLNTVMPKGQSWATEDQAMADIGKQMGDEFSKNFFLQHFNFGVRPVSLDVTGLPDADTARQLLRELRGMRQVLDARLTTDSGKYQLQLPEGRSTELVQEAIIKPLNAKLGQVCFTLAGSSDTQVSVSFSAACADVAVRGKMETLPPAGLLGAPSMRGAPLLKSGAAKLAT